ncbi:putative NUDIX hydrolase [Xanthomonas phage Xoo-sp13]|nr:putative NUDIX hydrolase [Xanthomonas phage Xoo-sp13]
MNYVCGFAFDYDMKKVALVLKNRPKFLAGKYNGLGGKIEDTDNSPNEAMAREFAEECGVSTDPQDWQHIGILQSQSVDMSVLFMYIKLPNTQFDSIKTMEDEQIFQMPLHNIRNVNLDIEAEIFLNAVLRGNVSWISVLLK